MHNLKQAGVREAKLQHRPRDEISGSWPRSLLASKQSDVLSKADYLHLLCAQSCDVKQPTCAGIRCLDPSIFQCQLLTTTDRMEV